MTKSKKRIAPTLLRAGLAKNPPPPPPSQSDSSFGRPFEKKRWKDMVNRLEKKSLKSGQKPPIEKKQRKAPAKNCKIKTAALRSAWKAQVAQCKREKKERIALAATVMKNSTRKRGRAIKGRKRLRRI